MTLLIFLTRRRVGSAELKAPLVEAVDRTGFYIVDNSEGSFTEVSRVGDPGWLEDYQYAPLGHGDEFLTNIQLGVRIGFLSEGADEARIARRLAVALDTDVVIGDYTWGSPRPYRFLMFQPDGAVWRVWEDIGHEPEFDELMPDPEFAPRFVRDTIVEKAGRVVDLR